MTRNLVYGDVSYSIFSVKDHFNCGALASGPSYKPADSGVVVYLNGSDDLSNVLGRVKKAGGKVLLEKTSLSKEAGYIGLFIDTEGNKLGIQSMA
jgi:uncharacterized protein